MVLMRWFRIEIIKTKSLVTIENNAEPNTAIVITKTSPVPSRYNIVSAIACMTQMAMMKQIVKLRCFLKPRFSM